MVGRIIAHYQIVEKLGEGGMGVVYKARDTHLDRFVALKVLPPEKTADPERRRRFVQEAKAASALNHPNIVTIHDIAQADGIDFIVMEHVVGKTLDTILAHKGLSIHECLKYAVQIADGLAKAHAAGIVHRDLKPSNIMITGSASSGHSEQVKILDFGLAKLIEGAGGSDPEITETVGAAKVATEEGVILGTVAYMSPEQAEGGRIDARSDIFAMGAILYETLTGRRAFRGITPLSTMSAILRDEPPPLRQVAPGVPYEMERIVARCLRKDPQRRFQHMDDLKVALEEIIEECDSDRTAPVAQIAPRKTRRRRFLIWAAAVFAASAVAIFTVRYFWRSPESPDMRTRVAPLTAYPGNEEFPSLSPDGNQVAFSWGGATGSNSDIYVKLTDTGTPLRLTTDQVPDRSPSWSPDGRFVAFLRGKPGERAAVLVVPALGGPEGTLAEVAAAPDPSSGWSAGGSYLSWSPDSTHLLIMDRRVAEEPFGLFALSVQTREKRPLLKPLPTSLGDGNPAVSPDGHWLAFVRSPSYIVSDLYVVALSDKLAPSGEPVRLTFDNRRVNSPVWTPDGKEIIFTSDRNGDFIPWRISPDGRGGPRPVNLAGQFAGTLSISWSPAKTAFRLAYVDARGANRDIWEKPLAHLPDQTGRAVRLISSTRDDLSPSYSPDGKKIAFTSNQSGSYEIWVCGSDGANQVPLTSFGGPATDHPTWSPDGKRIAFHSRPEGQAEIYVINAEGGKPRRLTEEPAEDVAPSWSRDGAWIYFGSKRTGQHQIWKVPEGGGAAVPVTKNGGIAAFESSDRQYVYYTKQRGNTSLWKAPVAGGPETKVTDSLFYLNFTPVKEGIYCVREEGDGEPRSIALISARGGLPKTIAPIESGLGLVTSIDLSPDRGSLLYAQYDSSGRDLMLVENFR
jgi:Tol biopolymer transport system component